MTEKQYTEEDVERAVAAVQAKVPISRAARLWGIPRTTLRRRLTGSLPGRQAQEQYQRIPPEQEKRLADWVLLQASLGLPPTHAEVRFFAQEILLQQGDPQPLGKHWIRGFLGRYPEIRPGRTRRMELARVKGATTTIIKEWWARLQVPEVARIKPENTYNADEGGLQEGKTGNGLVLGLAEARPLQRKEPGTRTWTSFIECVSATGVALPPLIIFKGKSVQEQWFPEDLGPFRGWEFTATDNGWTTDSTGVEWLQKVFLPGTQPPAPAPRLLILDGHGSHVTKEFMFLCLQNDVYLLYLPAHTSHVLQPLDLSVFSPLKHAYRQKLGSQALFTCSTVVGKRQFLTAYAYARTKAFTPYIITSGWRATGLWPRNPLKPLMNRLLLENSNRDGRRSAIQQSAEDNRAKKRSEVPFRLSQVGWETPKRSRGLATQISTFKARAPPSPTTRLFFRKVQKGYEVREFELATAQQKIRQLEAELEAQRPRKRKRVVPDPNQAFVDIRRVAETRGDAIEVEESASETAENSDQESVHSCIMVG
ncbi:hypothetical protein RB595_004887 [Gaeumannomyces hyphopodioides]